MALLPILRYPHPRLRDRSEEVHKIDDDLRRLVTEMVDTMYAANGAGLAAIQVGMPLRLFVIDGQITGGAEDAGALVLVNPQIVEISKESQTGDEGCLSFPGIFVPVKRGLRVRVTATDMDGKPIEIEGQDLLARALQHEIDHLDGKLLIDNVGPVKREIIKRKLRKEAEAEAKADEGDDGDDRASGTG
jgi:peptide deformylase